MKRSFFSNGINGIFELWVGLGSWGTWMVFLFFLVTPFRIVSSLSSRQNGQVPFSSID